MNNRMLIGLGAAAAVVLAAALVVDHTDGRAAAKAERTYLVSELPAGAIAAVAVTSATDGVTLELKGDRFGVAERGGYPARLETVEELIRGCLGIKVGDRITDRAVNHADLGVTEGQARARVRFLDAQGRELAGLLVGKEAEEGGGTYVRKAGEDDVFLSQQAPWIRTAPSDYLDLQPVEADRNAIVKVSVTGTNGAYTLTREAEGGLKLDPVPAGKQPKKDEVERVFYSLAGLRFQDVRAAGAEPVFDRTVVVRLADSTEYTFKLAEKDGKTLAAASAEFTDKAPVTIAQDGKDSEAELKAKEAKLKAQDAVEAFNKRHAGWLYELDSWQGGSLAKPLAELVEDPPKEAPAEPAS